MIWFRRIFAIPLILIALVLFIVALVITELNSTVANPKFYNDQLAKADMYNFIYDKALPAALDEWETDASSDLPINVTAFKSEIISAANETLPPDWLRRQVESATGTLIPYLRGSSDGFNYTILFKDRVQQGAQAINYTFLQGETAAKLYDNLTKYAAEKMVENLDNLPYNVSLNETQVEDALRTTFSQEWMTSQISAVIDSVTRYMTGDSDHFNITTQVHELVDLTANATIKLLATQQTYDYLLEQIITPEVNEKLGAGVNLPFEVSLNQTEISAAIQSAVKKVLPQWEHDRFVEIVQAFADYVKGESQNISVTINLTDSKADALNVLTGLVDRKLEPKFTSLTVVNWTVFQQAIQNLSPENPLKVRPEGVSYENFTAYINPSVTYWVNKTVFDPILAIPDQWSFTKDDLIKAMGADNADLLDKTRDWVSEACTDVGLRAQLSADNVKTLDDIRHYIANGYTITETDLEDKISKGGGDISNINQARDIINTVRTWLWVLWLLPLILLLCAGLLIARSLEGKLLWFLGLLFVIFLIFYIAFGVGYSHFGEPRIEKILHDHITSGIQTMFTNPADHKGIETIMIDKSEEVANNVLSSFVSGIQSMALYTMIGSGIAFLGIVVWSIVRRE